LDRIGAKGCIAANTLALRRDRAAIRGTIREKVTITNFGMRRERLQLRLVFDADFADIYIIRGLANQTPGRKLSAEIRGKRQVCLRFLGKDGMYRMTRLAFSRSAAMIEARSATFNLSLRHRQAQQLTIEIAPFVTVNEHCRRRRTASENS